MLFEDEKEMLSIVPLGLTTWEQRGGEEAAKYQISRH